MDSIEHEFRKVFGDMYLSESETALRIFEYGYKAGVAAENEACAKVCEEWGVYEAMECAAMLRERMK